MTDEFAGKVAIVTGGGSGIGEALCQDLSRRGARVVVADINGSGATRVAAAITGNGGRAEASIVDVAKEQDIRRLVEETAAAHGRLDYLFNNAGIVIAGDARYLTPAHWRQVLDVDLNGVLHGTLAAYPIMARQGFGHIVNTASADAIFPHPANAPYSTAKHAVVGLSLSLRLEAADLGVKISCACPGFVRTNIFQNMVLVNPSLPAGVPREELAGVPAKTMEPARAAQLILHGVARNQALIVFPASIRRARRLYGLFPRLIEREILRQFRQRRKRYQAAAPDPGKPGALAHPEGTEARSSQ